MDKNVYVLGVDIGSVSIALVEMTSACEIVWTGYQFHQGKIRDTMVRMLGNSPLHRTGAVAVTSSSPRVMRADRVYDNRVAVMKAVANRYGRVDGILMVGGEKFGLIQYDSQGNYINCKSNTSCAAGTGSFLDQQAGRLGLSSAGELSDLAIANTGPVPRIASRCSVFAKTDLVHAQQEGYTLSQICDGLCLGLARNIVDTLFTDDTLSGTIVFTGGVAQNAAVVRHMEKLLSTEIQVGEPVAGAAGAALHLLEETQGCEGFRQKTPSDLLAPETSKPKKWFYPPLSFSKTTYPDFTGFSSYLFTPDLPHLKAHVPVEVDWYENLENASIRAFIGMDIGSTSTKAVLLGTENQVLAGFYTRTAGKPVSAVQSILAAMDDIRLNRGADFRIQGVGTTGSGRKFVGQILQADLVLDEITAHARAAVEIEPAVDTIIEIGGQDSKFTTLKDGQVTFSVMNTVCAAGTGSFVEEQAKKLDCPLEEFSQRTENRRSPIASDRCTVFMERDINHYLANGYDSDEVLGSVLHSIVENYLTKVAIEANIGETVYFQGATAKNKALVAAFEQRLGKPIHVSRYCHLTGALGTALSLADQMTGITAFPGITLFRQVLPITTEVCELCTNHCKITVTQVNGERVAYGFLCGRDDAGDRYVNSNHSGFDLFQARRKAARFPKTTGGGDGPVVGLPDALHMAEDIFFWQFFFDALGIPTKTSSRVQEAVKTGKKMAGAEFCAPLAALHGHVDYLLERCDYVFLPFYLERKTERKNARRHYCYYTQFSPSLLYTAIPDGLRHKLLMPLENYLYSSFHDKIQLYRMLRKILPRTKSFFSVSKAFDEALAFDRQRVQKLQTACRENIAPGTFHVVLLGRPYTVLSPAMNKRIPDLLGAMGVKAVYQDMLTTEPGGTDAIDSLLDEVHWNYAARILSAACAVAQRKGAYPVFVTSFKCTPDAFAADYLKQVMEIFGKPYLILQLDEHDSSVGYETRIEAAVRSFQNHYEKPRKRSLRKTAPALSPSREKNLGRRTLLIPNWDSYSLRMVAAAFQKEGIDARLLEEDTTTIQKSLRHNTGQCIPLNIIAQECMDYVHKHDLEPEKTVLWNVRSNMACNLALFPHHIKNIFRKYGGGMEKIGVYAGEISFMDISMRLPVNIYFCYLFGGLMRKIGCRIRPYETVKGVTDQVIEQNVTILEDAFRGNRSRESALEEVVANFERIPWSPADRPRPKVAVFGDLYARDNEIMNQDLTRFIEAHGGEVVVSPFSSYVKMVEKPYIQKWFRERLFLNVISYKTLIAALKQLEKTYRKYFDRLLPEPEQRYDVPPQEILVEYGIRPENSGESIDNVLKVFYSRKHYPDISLFVQTSPAFCCPSLVTEAMGREIERKTGVPMVSITYDGTGGSKNDVIIPYLKYPRTANSSSSAVPSGRVSHA